VQKKRDPRFFKEKGGVRAFTRRGLVRMVENALHSSN